MRDLGNQISLHVAQQSYYVQRLLYISSGCDSLGQPMLVVIRKLLPRLAKFYFPLVFVYFHLGFIFLFADRYKSFRPEML